ncbi:MAG TPA: glycoside hydrolase, partial [Bryobacteraceae bacterium]
MRPLLVLLLASAASAASYSPALFSELRWRSIGPQRGGRTKSAAGVPSQPNVFYIGVCNGGVWKTTDYGRTWFPIFDDQPTGSIGAVAVAPSDPNVIYVGSGEGLQRPDLSVGDGVYKSNDAGKTWTHLGLREGQQIPQIAIDPRNPDRLFVAVLGHPYGPNAERGIYRSTDGGRTFEKVLGKDENTGASDVVIDPANPNTVYAALWEARQGPWENGAFSGTGGGIFKSTDGGATWHQLTKGLENGVIQANLAIAPSNPRRLYASIATAGGGGFGPGGSTGIYRSDDAGESWTRITTDQRPAGRIGGGDVSVPAVDPKNPDTVYVASIVTWKSTDGGKTWTA